MRVGRAKDVARQWLLEEIASAPGVHGAYLAGSASWLPDDAPFPATSDLDVNLVLGGTRPPNRPGKLVYRGILLDITHLSIDQLRSPELVLSHYHLAGGFRAPSVILDPSGQLTRLQSVVADGFARRRWVEKRCAHARNRILEQLAALDAADALHDQVIGWLFPTGVLTHLLLVAGLKNPTVRRRYTAAGELLAEYGHLDLYEPLLEALGCARMDADRVEQHLSALTEVFDAAKVVIRTPFSFASDISDLARPIAIDGSRELIVRGHHREAVFWIAVTYSRCMTVLAHDAPPDMRGRYEPGYRQLLGDLGITSSGDLRQRREQVLQLLPRVWHTAEAIMAANPQIED